MSYLALARKWRPRTFSELVGQNHISKALINALTLQRIHHAYLFTGTRGVGKTSVARILAKALNCERGITPEPCLQCHVCTAIEQGRFIDLIEIDGASKTRVEDTRDLLDNVQYAPSIGRFKIYLIDEVHMLSQHSFNALLKTLEEPPEHVKFILATTDPQKLPVTVLSRCLQFNLRHLQEHLITEHLELILKEEQLEYEKEALEILALAAKGSMRDALSILDQVITSCDKQLLASDIKSILGYTQQDYALRLLLALAEKNAPQILELSQQIAIEGGHFQYVLGEILSQLHQMAIYQSLGDKNPLISPSTEIKALVHHFSAEDLQLFYQIGMKGQEEIHVSPTLAVGFNMTMLRMLIFRPASQPGFTAMELPKSDTMNNRPLPDDVSNKASADVAFTPELQYNKPLDAREEQPVKMQANASLEITDEWNHIISKLNLSGLALNAIKNAEFSKKDGREITLKVDKGHSSLFTPTSTERIETALTEYYQSPIKIILNNAEVVHATPAQIQKKVTQQKQEKAEAALRNDPLFQQIKEEFSAELIQNSIVPLKDNL